MKYAIGLDIGGTKIQSVLVEWDKNFLGKRKLPRIVKSRHFPIQHREDRTKFYAEITRELEKLIDEFGSKNIARIGIGIAAPLSRTKQLVEMDNPHLPLGNFPLRARIQQKFKVPAFASNDANCFTWAEHLFGSAKKASSTVGITLGTAVGGGIVFDVQGKPFLWEGFHGSAAEIGFMILGEGETSFSQLCSSEATYLWRNNDPLIAAQKAEEGDIESQEGFRRLGFWLGVAISNIVNIINPEMVVIGGSISKSIKLFEKDMLKSAEDHIASPLAKKTPIVQSQLGDEAGGLGAAYLLE